MKSNICITEIPKKVLETLNNWEQYGTPAFKNEARRIKHHLLTCPDCQKEITEDINKNLPCSLMSEFQSWAEKADKNADVISAKKSNEDSLFSLETIEKAFFNYDRPPLGNYQIDNHLKKKREEWKDFVKTLEEFHLFS